MALITRPALRLVPAEEPAHKVAVRFCAGHKCTNVVTTHKVRQNIARHREYCSLFCYSYWSPEMRNVIERFPSYDRSPAGLKALILDLKADAGITIAAEDLGVSRSTATYWLKKCTAIVHTFPGQTPSSVLRILAAVSDHQGPEYAAGLIEMNPRTLGLAIDELNAQETRYLQSSGPW